MKSTLCRYVRYECWLVTVCFYTAIRTVKVQVFQSQWKQECSLKDSYNPPPQVDSHLCVTFCCRTNKEWYDRGLGRSISDILYWLAAHCLNEISIWPKLYKKSFKGFRRYGVDTKFKGKAYDLELWPWPWVFVAEWWVLHTVSLRGTFEWSIMKLVQTV